MQNKPLKTIFHIDETLVDEIYKSRFYAPYTQKLGIYTKKDSRDNTYEMFTCITPEMMLREQRINDLILKLERIIHPIPPIAIKQFFTSCLRDEIKATNDIEGVHSSRKEIDYALEQQQHPEEKKNTRLWGIVNKYQKLITNENISFKTCEDLRIFYDDFALDEVVNDDLKNIPDGKYFRKDSVSVNDGFKDIHTGLSPEDKIISTMTIALNILNDINTPLLTRISIFHYLFGYIHPFYDGNGRTSRFITSYYLAHNKNPLLAIRLSVTIKRAKRFYYKLFEDANQPLNRGELTYFILGFLAIFEKSLTETIEILEKKANDFNIYQKILFSSDLKKPDKKIYNVLLQAALFSDNLGATVKEIAETIDQHENTVQRNLQRMQEETNYVLVHHNQRAYRYELNLNNFSIAHHADLEDLKELEELISKHK